jgi:multidrug efflux pump subunit AcrA (membrane-fusion protein)
VNPLKWLAWLVVAGFLVAGLVAGGPRIWNLLVETSAEASASEEPVRLDVGDTVVEARLGSVESVLVLDGVVAARPSVEVLAGPGVVEDLRVREGEAINRGDALMTIVMPDEEGAESSVIVQSPIAGTVSLTVVEGDPLADGTVVALVQPRDYEMVARIDPHLLYRLYEQPEKIVVALDHGPAPFECPFLWLGSTDPTNPYDAAVELRCAIPGEIRAFPGVRGKLGVTTGRVDDVVVIPLSAVIGDADIGIVVVEAAGRRERRTVSLGLTDGVVVEIIDGLRAGEEVIDLPELDQGGTG